MKEFVAKKVYALNEVEQLLEKLKHYYGVGTYQEVAQNLGVARNTVSGWISRNSLKSIKRKIYELKLPIDFNIEQSKGIKMQKYILVEDTNKKAFLNEVAEKLAEGFEVVGGVALNKTKDDQILYAQAMIQKIHIQTRPY